MRWYVSQNGKTSGPFTEQRIAMLVNWGKISSEAYLCDEKWACWVMLRRSQFAPLLGDLPQEAPVLTQPPGADAWWLQRVALALLVLLAAGAFLLAVWLSPHVPPGPLGQLLPAEPSAAQGLARAEAAPVAHTERPTTPV